jgi:hypothetical protein
MRDMVEHTGKAFLGLTFNCAHCHDHKYDPITNRDYFQFRAFFEPIQVRQDWVKGEPDPGPFQKYEYSTTRNVVTNGLVSVFDENLDAKTFIYLRGDERSFPEGKPSVEAAMPAFLRGDSLKPQRLDLPLIVRYPGLKSFVQQAETQKRERALTAAKEALAAAQKAFVDTHNQVAAVETVHTPAASAKAFSDALTAEASLQNKSNQLSLAQADLDAIRARIAADEARYSSSRTSRREEKPEIRTIANGQTVEDFIAGSEVEHQPMKFPAAEELAAAASRAERLLALRRAEAKLVEAESTLGLLQAEQAIGAARRSVDGTGEKKEDQAKADAMLKKVQEQAVTARKGVETAQAALQTNSLVYTPLSPVYPEQSTGRRRALASWMISRENPLTARVAVNHIWTRHFHAPLVASVFDFGRNGLQPTHPELLDWLAVEFMEHGWSMKHLHRLIVTSSAYRQASAVKSLNGSTAKSEDARPAETPFNHSTNQLVKPRTAATVDRDNRYLWHMNPGQMEGEVLRDSLLVLADELDLTPAGFPLPNADAEKSPHRSLYFECFPEPNGQSQFAEMFDPPNPTECYRRSQTIVPQQALALSNSKLSNDSSRRLAQRLVQKLPSDATADESAFITAAYEQILTRRPTEPELDTCRDFFAKQSKTTKPDAARASLVHALFNHNDFVTIR